MQPPWTDRPILVTGLPRSGTSMVAGALKRCGAWLGRTVGRGPSNPKGFFENRALREHVSKAILETLGSDPLGVKSLPDPDREVTASGLRERVLAVLEAERYAGERPWLFKDAKLSLTWPEWNEAFPEARWVIVRRQSEDVVRSCLNTHFMAEHSTDPQFWQDFAQQYLKQIERLKASGAWWREIWPQKVVVGDLAPLEALVAELYLEWNEHSVRRFVQPRHWHGEAR